MGVRERRLKETINSASTELKRAARALDEAGFKQLAEDIGMIITRVQSVNIHPDDLNRLRSPAGDVELMKVREHRLEKGCWCDPEDFGDGVIVHREVH